MAKGKGENRDLGPSPWVEVEEEEEEDGWGGRLKGKRDRRQTDFCVASYPRVYCTTVHFHGQQKAEAIGQPRTGKLQKKLLRRRTECEMLFIHFAVAWYQ